MAASSTSSSRVLSWQASLGFQPASHFDEAAWKARFINWIILEDVTFRQVSSRRLQWLIANGGGLASQLVPEDHTTVCSWIRQSFERRHLIIFDLVKNAKSSIHLSFDLWTASNGFNYIGTVSHFIDITGQKRDVLLGLPRLVGSHSGENIASGGAVQGAGGAIQGEGILRGEAWFQDLSMRQGAGMTSWLMLTHNVYRDSIPRTQHNRRIKAVLMDHNRHSTTTE